MNVASLELCKTLFELSGWLDCDYTWVKDNNSDQIMVFNTTQLSDYFTNHHEQIEVAYDLGYLLRKLPKTVDFPDEALAKIAGGMSAPAYLILCQHIDTMTLYWDATYQHEDSDTWIEELRVRADTPEDAACKLAIELFKQKVLT